MQINSPVWWGKCYEHVGLSRFWSKPGLHSEFMVSQGYWESLSQISHPRKERNANHPPPAPCILKGLNGSTLSCENVMTSNSPLGWPKQICYSIPRTNGQFWNRVTFIPLCTSPSLSQVDSKTRASQSELHMLLSIARATDSLLPNLSLTLSCPWLGTNYVVWQSFFQGATTQMSDYPRQEAHNRPKYWYNQHPTWWTN